MTKSNNKIVSYETEACDMDYYYESESEEFGDYTENTFFEEVYPEEDCFEEEEGVMETDCEPAPQQVPMQIEGKAKVTEEEMDNALAQYLFEMNEQSEKAVFIAVYRAMPRGILVLKNQTTRTTTQTIDEEFNEVMAEIAEFRKARAARISREIEARSRPSYSQLVKEEKAASKLATSKAKKYLTCKKKEAESKAKAEAAGTKNKAQKVAAKQAKASKEADIASKKSAELLSRGVEEKVVVGCQLITQRFDIDEVEEIEAMLASQGIVDEVDMDTSDDSDVKFFYRLSTPNLEVVDMELEFTCGGVSDLTVVEMDTSEDEITPVVQATQVVQIAKVKMPQACKRKVQVSAEVGFSLISQKKGWIPPVESKPVSQTVATQAVAIRDVQSQEKTQICRSLLCGARCPHRVCRFAHTIEELASSCRFGDRCRCVEFKGKGVYVNDQASRVCKFKHPQESLQSLVSRLR